MTYEPPKEILEKYADVLINFALNNCNGIKKGDVVLLQVSECAKPMLLALRRKVLEAGGHPITQFLPDEIEKEFYDLASDEQLKFFPEKYLRGKVDQIDHSVFIIAETNKHELSEVAPEKIMQHGEALKPYKDWRNEKENAGKFTWTLALYGTEAMAKEAGMTLEEYWEQIINACYLNEQYPISKWEEITSEVERVKDKLNALKIESLHIVSTNTDLTIGLGKNRKWMGGSGRNIPSFEVFISPDWRKTEGHISFNQPLYRYGTLVKNIKLKFENGQVTSSGASEGEKLLKEMIATPNADKVGEFSLTDSRVSKITKFMAETLFDENLGGTQGNTHIALGSAYKDSYPGDPSTISKTQWEEMGYNDSSVHTDIISTEQREVTATLEDGKTMVIYKDGKFVI
jgi:aminopeptidase